MMSGAVIHKVADAIIESGGGRGITVCDRWRNSFKWSTLSEQRRNNRCTLTYLEYKGKRMIIADWAKVSGISQENISSRVRKGWSIEDAIFKPTVRRKKMDCGSINY